MESGQKQQEKKTGYERLKAAFIRNIRDPLSPQARLDREVREFADRKHAERYKLFETHGHTEASDGAIAPEEYAEIAKRRGLDFVAVTDHDSNEAWMRFRSAAKKEGIVPVKGREVTAYQADDDSNIGHFIGLFPDDIPISKLNSDLEPNQPFGQALRRIKRMEGYTVAPHYESLDGIRGYNVLKYAKEGLLDAVADDEMARKAGIKSVKGSDAHTKPTIGIRGVLIKDQEGRIKTGSDLIKYLKEGGEIIPYELRGGSFIDAADIASKVSNIYYWPKGLKHFWYKFMTKRGLDMLKKDLHEYFVYTLPRALKRNKTTVKKVAAAAALAAGAYSWISDNPAAGTPKHFIGSTLLGAGVYHFSKKSKNKLVKYGAPVAAALGAELLYKFYVEPTCAEALNRGLGKIGVFGGEVDYDKLLKADLPATVAGAGAVPFIDRIEVAEENLVKGYNKLKEKFSRKD